MRLIDHPDFVDLVGAAARASSTPEAFVEKDYHVTAILRLYREQLGAGVVFKGGTSLSKGWALVDRFSEDVDLFLARDRCDPPITTRGGVDRALKGMRDSVGALGLAWLADESGSHRGVARRDWFEFEPRSRAAPLLRPAVLVEIGTRSGDFPVVDVSLNSIVGHWIVSEGLADTVAADDIAPFDMGLLHFRRTFVEKLFAIHSLVGRVQAGESLGRGARHYADLFALAGTDEVRSMLASGEYRTIYDDCAAISAVEFPTTHAVPDGDSFASSAALDPDGELRAALAADYAAECALLFYGPYPTFDEVLERLSSLAPSL
jgi:hypothetical protein